MYDKLKSLIPTYADDGSKELANQWLDAMRGAGEVRELLQNPGFQRVIGQMRADFSERLLTLVNSDPELRAMRKMFVRTIGLSGAEEQIAKSIEGLIERSEEDQSL